MSSTRQRDRVARLLCICKDKRQHWQTWTAIECTCLPFSVPLIPHFVVLFFISFFFFMHLFMCMSVCLPTMCPFILHISISVWCVWRGFDIFSLIIIFFHFIISYYTTQHFFFFHSFFSCSILRFGVVSRSMPWLSLFYLISVPFQHYLIIRIPCKWIYVHVHILPDKCNNNVYMTTCENI